MVPNISIEENIVVAMTKIDHTADSYPTARPDNIVVAEPVAVAFRISWTGLPSVPVKYSVRRSIAIAKQTPTVVARKGLHQPPGSLFM